MSRRVALSRARLVGIGALALLFAQGDLAAAVPDNVDQMIRRADDLKTADNTKFLDIVQRLESGSSRLSASQRAWLHYFEAWQLAYAGDKAETVPALKAVIAEADDEPTIRFRAEVTLINYQAIAGQFEEAYALLEALLELQPRIPDSRDRNMGFAVAALLFNQAGQYDLALKYADRWLADSSDPTSACRGMYLRLDALYRSGKLKVDDRQVQSGIDACEKIGEPLYANLIRTFVANIEIGQGRVADAIALIETHDAELQRTHSARVGSEFHSILARAYLLTGDLEKSRRYAQSAADRSIRNAPSKPLADAYEVLSKIAETQGDYKAALDFHKQFVLAAKVYLDDVGARALAYQMVSQHVAEKKRQIDALTETTRLLHAQEQLAAKTAETERLNVLLLITVIGFIVLWGLRTKRAQLRFQKLSRRDGLTGILNRQHFMDEALAVVRDCGKSRREVCLILIDLDNFKSVNDSYGHAAGDVVLQCAAAVLQAHMRVLDLFGRLGGEEFGVLLPGCTLEIARHRAEEMRLLIRGMDRAETGIGFDVSASLGVVSTDEAGYDLRQMLIHADGALYSAKRQGRDRVEAFVALATAAAG